MDLQKKCIHGILFFVAFIGPKVMHIFDGLIKIISPLMKFFVFALLRQAAYTRSHLNHYGSNQSSIIMD